MKLLRNLLLVGLAAGVTKYYLNKPEKIEEHKEIAKEKLNKSIDYSNFLISYTQKNGILASAEYLKNDFDDLIKEKLDKIGESDSTAVKYGKDLWEKTSNLKENIDVAKEKGIVLTDKISQGATYIKEEVSPRINSYVDSVKVNTENIKEKVGNIKNDINKDKVKEKISDFTSKSQEVIEKSKEKINNLIQK